jgi:hypothetical protein
MSKAVQIYISQPCHENWYNMTPNEQGRFCDACQKTVVDFSAMSDKELLEYVANVSGYNACGRFSSHQLNREIKTAENIRRFSWAYVWNILLATFMITEADAQGRAPRKRAIVPSVINRPDTGNMAISTIGYKAQTFDIKDNRYDQHPVINPLLLPELKGRVGGYSVTVKTPLKERVSRVINNCIPTPLKRNVAIYPNPVLRGNLTRLKLALPKDDYKLEVLSTSGQVMLVLPLYIQTKEQLFGLPTRAAWNAGSYWVRISSNTTKKVFQSKLLLQ